MSPLRPTAACLLLLPPCAEAHFFVQPYTLPVPFTLYAWGAALALGLSFLVIGLTARRPAAWPEALTARAAAAAHGGEAQGWGWAVARALSVGLLALCVVAGLIGTPNPFRNISMTLFWIVFVLGLPYAVALAGDFYGPANPWRALVDAVARLTRLDFDGRLRRPERLGHAPALVLYMGFIWLELFGRLSPRGLAWALLAYTAINLAGAWWLGRDCWFRRGEFFGVMMDLLGRMSPRARPWDPAQRVAGGRRWRLPFAGLLEQPVRELSLVLFILFMLSSTAFDGLHATLPWAQVFWKHVYPDLAPWFPTAAGRTYAVSVQLYYAWQWLWLLSSPLVYLAVFLAFLWLARKVGAGGAMTLAELARRFAPSLVPIAFVYHVTHYYTLLLAQGGQLLRLISDPFGWRWDLFGTATLEVRPVMLDVGAIWHTQIGLILLGHIVGVYLAHVEALKIVGTPRQALFSQLPMLALMMAFTTFGLWILSMPLAGG